MESGKRGSRARRNPEGEIRVHEEKLSEARRKASRLSRSLKQKERKIADLEKALERSNEWEKQLMTLSVLSRVLNSTLEHRTVRRRAMAAREAAHELRVGCVRMSMHIGRLSVRLEGVCPGRRSGYPAQWCGRPGFRFENGTLAMAVFEREGRAG